MEHRTRPELDEALDSVMGAPAGRGTLELIVSRPAVDEREVLPVGFLSTTEGLRGDNWIDRPSRHTPDGGPHPGKQLNVISSRVSELLAGRDPRSRALAGDQLHLDLDLSEANLPAGTRLRIGAAVIEVTSEPHRGCAKFARRFGTEARNWVNDGEVRGLRLRGLCARVVTGGAVAAGDPVVKLDPGAAH